MPSLPGGRSEFQKLVKVLELSAGRRGGVFFVGRLQPGQQHEVVAQILSEYLGSRGLHVVQHRFDRSEELGLTPFESFIELLGQMRRKPRRSVLLVWGLEGLREPLLIDTMRKFSGRRGALAQGVMKDERAVPVVLLVKQGTYQEYLARWAGDFLDCVSSSFEL